MSNPVLDNLVNGIEERKAVLSKFLDPILQDSKNLQFMKHHGVEIKCPKNILILGCGGTGSWLAPKLIKILNDASSKGIGEGYTVLFCDGDEIEEKNIIRQNFVHQDIGKKKASVMAERYGIHLHDKCEVGFYDTFLVDKTYDIPKDYEDRFNRLESIDMFKNQQDVLIVNLIDNGKTRKLIHRFAINNSGKMPRRSVKPNVISVLDVANNEYNGQLNMSVYGIFNPTTYMAQFYNQHPTHLGDDEDISVFSCADADAEAVDQLFNANDMAATIAGNYINAWIMDGKLKFGAVEFVTGAATRVESSIPLLNIDVHEYGRDISCIWELDPETAPGIELVRFTKDAIDISEDKMMFELGYNKMYAEVLEDNVNNKTQYLKDIDHACSNKVATE